MSLDALAAAALADDLGAFVGARVQDVTAVDALTLCFELYAGARRYLTLSAAPDHPGLVVTDARTRRGASAPSPLALACRARLEGARLAAVVQPPHERILRFEWKAAAPVTLIAELTGRMANLILVDPDSTVLAAAHLVTAAQTRARTIVPGRPYAPPPMPLKRAPEAVSIDDVATWLAAAPADMAWRTIVARVRGVGPLAAREAVFRAAHDARAIGGDVDPGPLVEALAALTDLPTTHAWAPTVAVRAADGHVVGWAPFRLTHLAAPDVSVEDVPTTLEALARADAGRMESGDGYDNARAAVRTALTAAAARARRRREALERELEGASAEAVERLRLSGDLLLAYQWQVEPGATVLVAPVDPPLTIALDPALTPVENAKAYFDRYHRARRAGAGVPERVAAARAAEATIEQLTADLALAENRPEIDAVLDLLGASGLAASPIRRRGAQEDAASKPRRYTSSDGLTILVGRNSRQNEIVTFTHAARGDAWLHARDVPGAHVVVKAGGRPVPERTLLEAAALAAWFSGARDDAAADVAVTDARHVRRLGGGGIGMVTLSHDTTRTVRPASPRAIGL